MVIDDDYASNHHARISPHESGWIIEDLGSTNGTYVQRTRVTGAMSVPSVPPSGSARPSWSCASDRAGAVALTLRYAARSDVGLLRDGNEDSGYAGPHLLVVADGMGGAAAGEVASSVAVAALARLDEDEPSGDLLEVFGDAVRRIEDQLGGLVDAEPRLRGMGTTLTAVVRADGPAGPRPRRRLTWLPDARRKPRAHHA